MTSSVQAVAPQSIWRLFGLHKINWLKSHWAADSSPHIVTTVVDGGVDPAGPQRSERLWRQLTQKMSLTVDPWTEIWI